MPRSRAAAAAVALVALVSVLAACNVVGTKAAVVVKKPVIYLAVGASETIGTGADIPEDQAWPRVFFRDDARLPKGSTYVNVGVSGSTVADALTKQAPEVARVKPDLVTVWLNVNDLLHLVPTLTYEAELKDLVHQLRRGGLAKVLVANTPDLSHLPVVTACLSLVPTPGRDCPVPNIFRGPPLLGMVNSAVADYNAAIARVVAAEGAVLVDLNAAILARRADGTEPTLVSSDGFHPSTAGHAAVAAEFAKALVAAGGP